MPAHLYDLFPNRLVDSELGKIPEGWEVGTLGDYLNAVKGVSYKGSGLGASGMPLHNLNSIYEGGGYKYEGIKYDNREYSEPHVVRPGDVMVANTEQRHDRLLIGYAAIVPRLFGERGIASHHIYRLRPKPSSPLKAAFLCYLLNSPQMHDVLSGYANGTTVNMLPIDGVQKPKIVCPPRPIVAVFDSLALNSERRLEEMVSESRTLAALRDALLPKLIRGEIGGQECGTIFALERIMNSDKGFNVRIFIPSSEPEGLRIIEKSNWTGLGLIFPRVLLPEVRQLPEISRTGVYVLWGLNESGLLSRVYVGQSSNVLQRLEQHAREKDFWTHAAVFTSKDFNFNTAHAEYTEARLLKMASEAKRAELDNGNFPQGPSISKADECDANTFLENMLLCLRLLGVNFFDKISLDPLDPEAIKEFYISFKGIEARGVNEAKGFIIRAGSHARKQEVESLPTYIREIRKSLVDRGILVDKGDFYEFAQDYPFSSPSTAAGVVLGRSANGLIEWKDANGRTLKEIQEAGSS